MGYPQCGFSVLHGSLRGKCFARGHEEIKAVSISTGWKVWITWEGDERVTSGAQVVPGLTKRAMLLRGFRFRHFVSVG